MRDLKIEERITIRNRTIDRYFNDVGPVQRLSSEQEIELTDRIKAGDTQALEIMVRANLRFVISVAKQYSSSAELLSELIAQGNIGLIHSARTFDHTRGFKFISYAVWHIRKEILDYLSNNRRSIRLPAHVIRLLSQARKAEEILSNQLGREATLEEIAEELNRLDFPVTVETLGHIMTISENGIPLESMDPEEKFSPINWLNAEQEKDSLSVEDSRLIFNQMCSGMTPIEYDIVSLKLGIARNEPASFAEIGRKYDRTSEWARQVFNKALRKAKKRVRLLNYAK